MVPAILRLRTELRDLLELVLLPGLAAVLPWQICFRIFRRLDAFDEDGQPGEGLDLINIGRNKVRFCRGVNLGNAFADPVRYSAERVRLELGSDDPVFYRRFFIATHESEVVAIGGVKAADWASRTHILYLSAVAPERRGQGIGRALIKARLDWLEGNFAAGRILVSATKLRRFRDLGFAELRHGRIDGKHLLLRRF